MGFTWPAQPSDGMKKEMESLVEKLGADGIEARRQVRPAVQRHRDVFPCEHPIQCTRVLAASSISTSFG